MAISYHDQNRLIQVFIHAVMEERNRIELRNRCRPLVQVKGSGMMVVCCTIVLV